MAHENPKLRRPRDSDIEGTLIACPLPSPPGPDRGTGAAGNGLTLALPDLGHRISIPPGAIQETDGEVEFELAHAEPEDGGDPILMVAAHRIEEGDRTGYRFAAKVRVRISWARCDIHPSAEDIRVYKTSDGGESWRQIEVPAPDRGHPFVEFEDDSFSAYAVAT